MLTIDVNQKKAINHFNGPCLVLAGPGSGKTTVIANRILSLISEHAVKPENILVVTFSKAAAVEMKERFLKLYGHNGRNPGVDFGTFHAVSFRILRLCKNYDSTCIVSTEEKDAVVERLASNLFPNENESKDFISGLISEIGFVKGNGIDISDYYSPNCSAEEFRRLYSEYNSWLRKKHRLDFEDMLSETVELLNSEPEVLKAFRDRYRYILVDEFQDINPLQFRFLRLLSEPLNNVFAVGDDDQSIYGFRGASPKLMLDFPKIYKDARVLNLSVNYRSVPEIVECSARLISHNRNRYKKKITAGPSEKACGRDDTYRENARRENWSGALDIRSFENTEAENAEIVRLISEYRKRGVPLSDMAVLYRTNDTARPLLRRLTDCGIEFSFREGASGIMNHRITKDFLTYIRLSEGSAERSLYLSIINKPNRFISREIFEKPRVDFRELFEACRDREYVLPGLERLMFDIEYIRGMNPYAAFMYIRKGMGYDSYISEYAARHHLDEELLLEIAEELTQSAKGFATAEEWENHMRSYERELEIKRREAEKKKTRENGEGVLNITTFHAAKGLEYKIVFIPDAIEGVVPHKKAVLEADLEEERRAFYVALTRAKKRIHLFFPEERFMKEVQPSRFAEELQN